MVRMVYRVLKKAGRANVYCKYLTKSGTWIKSSVETIKVFEGGSVKFSYTLGLEDSPFGGEDYKVWDFYKHDTYDTTIPKFNVIYLNYICLFDYLFISS